MAYTSKSGRSYKYYDFLFLNKMKQILSEEKPDLIVCTHGFPSYFLNLLKSTGECNVPVINAYTDFFINDVWGKEFIDYHFAPNKTAKDYLVTKHNIHENRVIITGIPTNEAFSDELDFPKDSSIIKVLISGGSVGLGNIFEILQQTNSSKIKYYVLCGKNKKLFNDLDNLNNENIKPLDYISSRSEMNELYSKVDAIITKPGGGTVSEALRKGLPIFINSALPGQEEINLKMLVDLKLVQKLDESVLLEQQIVDFFENHELKEQFNRALQKYLLEVKNGDPEQISNFILSLLESN
jgi:UDP-N-acetylglucosamine:LPS N-acetylglucosamine transferase